LSWLWERAGVPCSFVGGCRASLPSVRVEDEGERLTSCPSVFAGGWLVRKLTVAS